MSEEPKLLADRLVSKYDMMDAVNGFLAKNGAIVALHVPLAQAHQKLAQLITMIPEEAVKRFDLKKGSSGSKILNREELAHMNFVISRALRALGKGKKIQELINIAKYTEKTLARMRFSDLANECLAILALEKKYKLDLVLYLISEEDITAFEDTITEYKDTLTQINVNRGEGVNSTKEIIQDFDQSDDILSEIDDIVESLMEKFPEFYGEYEQIRSVLYFGVRHKEVTKEKKIQQKQAAKEKKLSKKAKTPKKPGTPPPPAL